MRFGIGRSTSYIQKINLTIKLDNYISLQLIIALTANISQTIIGLHRHFLIQPPQERSFCLEEEFSLREIDKINAQNDHDQCPQFRVNHLDGCKKTLFISPTAVTGRHTLL